MKEFEERINKLRNLGLRLTKQRIMLFKLLFGTKDTFHFTIDELSKMYKRKVGLKISLATIYNTVHTLKEKGWLKEIPIDGNKIYYDTNTSMHHHFYDEDEARLIDFKGNDILVDKLPKPPSNKSIKRIELIIRVANNNYNQKKID